MQKFQSVYSKVSCLIPHMFSSPFPSEIISPLCFTDFFRWCVSKKISKFSWSLYKLLEISVSFLKLRFEDMIEQRESVAFLVWDTARCFMHVTSFNMPNSAMTFFFHSPLPSQQLTHNSFYFVKFTCFFFLFSLQITKIRGITASSWRVNCHTSRRWLEIMIDRKHRRQMPHWEIKKYLTSLQYSQKAKWLWALTREARPLWSLQSFGSFNIISLLSSVFEAFYK